MSYLNLQAWFRKGGRTFLSNLCPVLFHSEPIRRFSPHSPMYSLGIGDEQKKQPALPRAVEIYDSVSRLSS